MTANDTPLPTPTGYRYALLAGLLGILFMLGPVSIDAFIPAAADIAQDLRSDIGAIELSIAMYTLGAAFGQLFYGPLSDRFGRKPIILVSLIIYILAVLGGALASSMSALIVWRFVQGASTHAGRILAPAIARDLFEREQAGRLLSYMMFVAGFGPIFAPIIGGALTQSFGWPAVFYLMAAVAAVATLALMPLLPETLPRDARQPLRIKTLTGNAAKILCHRQFIGYTAIGALSMAGLFALLAAAPSIMQVGLSVPPGQFGLLFGLIMVANLVAATIGARIVVRIGLDRLIITGSILMVLGGVAMVVAAPLNSVAAFVWPAALYMVGWAWVFPHAAAGALSPFAAMAGTASSLMGFLQQIVSTVVVLALTIFNDGTQGPLAVTFILTGAVMCGIFAGMAWHRRSVDPSPSTVA